MVVYFIKTECYVSETCLFDLFFVFDLFGLLEA